MAAAAAAERRRSSGVELFMEVSTAPDNVFGMGDTGLPMWFKPERFLEPDFSPEAYVADLRRSIPLETLAHELEEHLSTLKAKLVEVINEDYNDFISLSTKLVNVDGAVLRMQKPLLEVKEKLTAVQAAVGAELEALGAGLQRRQQIASARALLELMQDAAHVMSKVEKLLAEVDAAEAEAMSPRSGPSSSLEARTRMFERLASEISRLSFYIARGKELPFIQQLEGRMAEASGRLQALLSSGLRDALKTGNVAARTHCLQAYAAVGDTAGAEEVVREAVVKPLVDRVLAEQRHGLPRSGPAAEPLAPVLEGVAAGVRQELGPLLEAVLAPQSGLHAFNFLANSLLAYLDTALADALPGAFSPGVPASFLANYKAAIAFLEGLESYCQLASDVAAFRAAFSYDAFLRRWKLSVYFSLRFQEIAGALETVVSAPALDFVTPETRPSGCEPRLELAASHSLHHCLLRCTGQDVFLPSLGDKFVKLALQLLARYREWLDAAFRARNAAAAAAASGDAGPPGAPALPQPGPSGSVEEGAMEGPAQHWALSCSSEQLAFIRADVDALADWLTQGYAPTLCGLLGFGGPQVTGAVAEAVAAAAGDVAGQGAPAINAIVVDIAERCAHVCKQMNGITATYRMTTRPLPSRPSHYVGGVLAPLRTFLDSEPAKLLRPPALAELTSGVVDTVAERYMDMAVKMLDTLRKTESSLKRLKKNRVAEAAADGSQLSDIDKISLQLFLDVEEFGRQAAKFGTSPSQLPGYQNLWRNVAPPDKQDAITVG